MSHLKFKLIGKVNKWDALMNTFELGMPGGDVEIRTNHEFLTDHLVEAMKTRENISISFTEED